MWRASGAGLRQRRAQIRKILAPHWKRVAVMAAASFLAGLVEAAMLVVITRVALSIADGDDSFGVFAGYAASVEVAMVVAGLLIVARLLLALLSVRLSVSLTVRVGVAARVEISDAFLRASWATQQAEPSGRLQELLMSFAGSVAGVAKAWTTALNAALSLVALFIGSLLINLTATLVVLAALVLLGSVLAPLRRRIRSRAQLASAAQMEFAASVSELGALGMEMQAFGVRDQFSGRVQRLISGFARAQSRAMRAQGILTPVYAALAMGALVAGLALATALNTGELQGIAAVMLVMMRSLSYGQALQSASGQLAGLTPYLEMIDETTQRYLASPAESGNIAIDEIGQIGAESISFAYEADVEVLHDLSFDIEFGEVIGVVGPSGGGKSTLVQLLLGLRAPTSGRIVVGGVDLRDVDRKSWTSLTAFVAQEPTLMSGSVSENIAFFRDGIDQACVESAAADAHVIGDIRAMPDGFETDVGERGGRLSGGQRQRVSIARALAGDPQLLVMDEPTSSLDVKSEHLIRQTLAKLEGRVTVVIIAHRLSTLEICDRIMVVEDGHLTAMAARDELSRDNHFFKQSLELSGLRP